jgi:hypothetical protein
MQSYQSALLFESLHLDDGFRGVPSFFSFGASLAASIMAEAMNQ